MPSATCTCEPSPGQLPTTTHRGTPAAVVVVVGVSRSPVAAIIASRSAPGVVVGDMHWVSADIDRGGRIRVPAASLSISSVVSSSWRRRGRRLLLSIGDRVSIHRAIKIGWECLGFGVKMERIAVVGGTMAYVDGAIKTVGVDDGVVINADWGKLSKSRLRGGSRLRGSHLFSLRGSLLSTFFRLPSSFCHGLSLSLSLGTIIRAHR